MVRTALWLAVEDLVPCKWVCFPLGVESGPLGALFCKSLHKGVDGGVAREQELHPALSAVEAFLRRL